MRNPIVATLVVAMLAAGPIAGTAVASSEARTEYEVPEGIILSFLAPGENPRIDPDVAVGVARIVESQEVGDMVIVLIECQSSPGLFCSGEFVTDT